MDVHEVRWLIWALLVAPVILAAIGWIVYLRRPAAVRPAYLAPLICVTVSVTWLLVSFRIPAVLGGSYSHWRFAVIDGNFVLMLLASIAAFSNTTRLKLPVGAACVLTTILWSFIGAMNATV